MVNCTKAVQSKTHTMSGLLSQNQKTKQKKRRKEKILLELVLSNATIAHTSSDPRAQTDTKPPQSADPTNTSVSKPGCFKND